MSSPRNTFTWGFVFGANITSSIIAHYTGLPFISGLCLGGGIFALMFLLSALLSPDDQ